MQAKDFRHKQCKMGGDPETTLLICELGTLTHIRLSSNREQLTRAAGQETTAEWILGSHDETNIDSFCFASAPPTGQKRSNTQIGNPRSFFSTVTVRNIAYGATNNRKLAGFDQKQLQELAQKVPISRVSVQLGIFHYCATATLPSSCLLRLRRGNLPVWSEIAPGRCQRRKGLSIKPPSSLVIFHDCATATFPSSCLLRRKRRKEIASLIRNGGRYQRGKRLSIKPPSRQ